MLPATYERWFVEACARPSPVESRSTCDSCAMLPGAPGLPSSGPYDPALRCCTYHPHLAPHFVGGILERGSAAGRAIVEARLVARGGVTPLGLGAPPHEVRQREVLARTPGAFGHHPTLLCPFYAQASARCTIWEHRGGDCASFHCKLDRGVQGQALWNWLLYAWNAVERVLTRWVIEQLGLDVMAADALLRAPADTELEARAWGRFFGREADYFRAAAGLIEPLAWTEVVALGGPLLQKFDEALRTGMPSYDTTVLPARVRRGPDVLYQLGPRVFHPAIPLDPLPIPEEVAARLATLVEAPLEALGLDEELARRLLDWQAIVPVTT